MTNLHQTKSTPVLSENSSIFAMGDNVAIPSQEPETTEKELSLLWIPYLVLTFVLLLMTLASFINYHMKHRGKYQNEKFKMHIRQVGRQFSEATPRTSQYPTESLQNLYLATPKAIRGELSMPLEDLHSMGSSDNNGLAMVPMKRDFYRHQYKQRHTYDNAAFVLGADVCAMEGIQEGDRGPTPGQSSDRAGYDISREPIPSGNTGSQEWSRSEEVSPSRASTQWGQSRPSGRLSLTLA